MAIKNRHKRVPVAQSAGRYSIILAIIILTAMSGCTRDMIYNTDTNVISKPIELNPYLQAVTPNSIVILIETGSQDKVFADYGLTNEYGFTATSTFNLKTTASNPTYVHRIVLKGLQPETVYHYQVRGLGEKTGDFAFITAARPGTDYKFAVLGDTRSNPDVHSQIATLIAIQKPAFSVYLGDACNSPDYDSWKNEFFVEGQLELAAAVPFFNTPGNHEGWSQNTRAFTQAPESASGSQAFYSFDYGDAHFLVLSTAHDLGTGSEQYKFAQQDLQSTDKTWKIVVFHVSAYAYGGHGVDNALSAMTANLLETNKVHLVLTGHSHFYQHNLINGIHHITAAGGGAPLKEPGMSVFTIKTAKQYHYAIANINPDYINIKVFGLDNEIIDNVLINEK